MTPSLCQTCASMREVITPRRSRFLLCQLSRTDPAFPKYPPQPVVRCDGYRTTPLLAQRAGKGLCGADLEAPKQRSTMSEYVLRGGQAGAERLRLLGRVVGPTTEALLSQLPVVEGMHCLDVGCGLGAVTLELARRAGPSG